MYDIWNNSYGEVEKVYQGKNYRIVKDGNCHNGICYIFFSSNNIWFPNTEKAFRYSFLENDYYEWLRYSSLEAEKIIYIRDIYKSWYVAGINANLNSLDKVITFLKKQTANLKTITVGSSAGGYMAALAAAMLHAERCICFSAQFDLETNEALGTNPFLQKYEKDPNCRKYYKIADIIKISNTRIFYIMPAFSKVDFAQSNCVQEVANVYTLKIFSHYHGVPIFTGNMNKLLELNQEQLVALFKEQKGKITGKITISIKLCGMVGTLGCLEKELIRIIKKSIRRINNE